MIAAAHKKKPFLRFKDDNGQEYPDWEVKKFEDVYRFISTNSYSRDNLNYKNGLVKNIHYGDILTKFKTQFNVDQEDVPFINNEISLDKYAPDNYCISGDLIISDASEDYEGIGKLIEINKYNSEKILAGLHTIHARQKSQDIEVGFAGHLLNSWNSRYQIMRIAQGTKVFGISSKRLGKISITIPSSEEEQKKIADFLSSVDQKIQLLEKKKEQLELYKKGLMQQLFTQQIRFKDDNGEEYPHWEEKKLGFYLEVSKAKNHDLRYDKSDVLSVSGQYGIVNQIKFQGRSFAGVSVHNYGIVEKGDIVYTKSPLKSNPYGIIKVNKDKAGIVSTLYAVYKCKPTIIGDYLDYYFQLDDNTNRYLRPLVQKGSKNDMKINNEKVLIDPIKVPLSIKEQLKIVEFLRQLDKKIEITNTQIDKTKAFKKGLLQQMFV